VDNVNVTVGVGSKDRTCFKEIEAAVEPRSTFSALPGNILCDLGHEPLGRQSFELPDGSHVERDIVEVPIRIGGKTLTTICTFRDEGAQPLLGMVTIQQFLLAVDTLQQKLVKVRGLA